MKTINSFISEKLKITKNMLNNQRDGYEYVDLGLPSGTLWAKCNLGAEKETDAGDYFAWGEIETKKDYKLYRWRTYKYAKGVTEDKLTKYCNSKKFGHNGFTDNITQLEPEDDAVRVNMSGGWYTPTFEQVEELVGNTKNEFVKNYNGTGVNGMLFTAKNGNTLFLPAAGEVNYFQGKIENNNFSGLYMYSTLDQKCCERACALVFSEHIEIRLPLSYVEPMRAHGFSIRPVINK
jgi:hypothetical protein